MYYVQESNAGTLKAILSADTTGSSGGGRSAINGDGLLGVSGLPIIPDTHYIGALDNI